MRKDPDTIASEVAEAVEKYDDPDMRYAAILKFVARAIRNDRAASDTLLRSARPYVETCACRCANASACRFNRCKNCGYPIGADGKTLVDHSCEEWDTCPECEGPLNERRIYGAL